MSVDKTHPDYQGTRWQMMRDLAAGEDKIKEAKERYLPKLGGQTDNEYDAYRQRASFHNATARTIDGLSGMIFRKPPIVNVPDGLLNVLDDVTLSGVPLQAFAEQVVDEELTVGRLGILVDFPPVDTSGISQAEAERQNLRPYLSMYTAEAILNWQTEQVAGVTMLTQVRLKETAEEPGDDEFEVKEIPQIRVLDLTEQGYRQRLYREQNGPKGKEWVQHGEDIFPQMGGPMFEIPFVFIGPRDTTPSVNRPPLLDLGFKNLDHYRQNADWQHARHFLAAGMTPWAKGVNQEEIENGTFDATGPTNLWISTSTEAEFGVMEFTGAGMESMEKGMDRAEQQMAALGARMLAPDKRQAEAAETAQIHRQGEISVLASMAMSISAGMTKALTWMRDWMRLGGDVSVELNTDYLPTEMSPQMLTALMQALQGGGISYETFFRQLQVGEIVAPDKTSDEELSEIQTGGINLNL